MAAKSKLREIAANLDPLKLLEATAASNHAVLTGHVGAETVYEVALPKASGAPARIFEIQGIP